jgi:uncharacterized protein
MERRNLVGHVRAAGRRLEGRCVVYDKPAKVRGITEVIRPSAFVQSLAGGRDVAAFIDHDPHRLIGRTTAGTLRLENRNDGLHFSVKLGNASWAHDILDLAERGECAGCSFGFEPAQDGEVRTAGRREVVRANLVEISVLSGLRPAYDGTTVQARAQPTPHRDVLVAWLRGMWP